MFEEDILQENNRCVNCRAWIDRGGGDKLGWCVSDKIAKNFEDFQSDNFMCQCESHRTQMEDTYVITGRDFGCVHFAHK